MAPEARARYDSSADVRDAVAIEDTTPMCTPRKKATMCCLLACLGVLIGVSVWLINYWNAQKKAFSDEAKEAFPGLCKTLWDCGYPYSPPDPPSPPQPPLLPFVEAEVVWLPATVFAGFVWGIFLLVGLLILFVPGCMICCVKCIGRGGGASKKEAEVNAAIMRFQADNSSFDESEIGWGWRAGIKDDPMKLEEVTLKDNFRFLKDGEGAFMHIVGLVSITFLPGIPWPRTGLPQLFNILSSPFSTFLPDTAGAINHVESVVPKGVTLPLLYFYLAEGLVMTLISVPGLLFAIFMGAALAAGKELPRNCVSIMIDVMQGALSYVAHGGLTLVLRPLMSPFFCSNAPWGNQLGNDGFLSTTMIMNIDGLGELGTPQYCWGGNWGHWLACLLSLATVSSVIMMPLQMAAQECARWSRERGLFQNEIRPKIVAIDPNHKLLTEKMQRTAMRFYDKQFKGVTRSRPFLAVKAVTSVLNAYFGMGSEAACAVPQLICNIALLVFVWVTPPSTDERENLLYRDLMLWPVMSNILALVTNPEATGLIVLWNLLTWFVILPGTAYHFHLKHKQYTASRENGEGPKVQIVNNLPSSDQPDAVSSI